MYYYKNVRKTERLQEMMGWGSSQCTFPTYDASMRYAQSSLLNVTMPVNFTISVKKLPFVLVG